MSDDTQGRPIHTTARAELLDGARESGWVAALDRAVQYDFYHLPCYHRLSAARCGGSEHLFVYSEGDYVIALPMLLRTIDGADGQPLCDATSVYGYAGPVASHARVPAPVIRGFQAELRRSLRERGVVALFSRLHPLIPHPELLAGIGEIRGGGQTVSIDLTLPQRQQHAAFRSGVRSRITRLRRDGIRCVRDAGRRHLREFCDIYLETMRRVRARDEYFFEPDYFTRLDEALGERLQLFVALKDGGVIAGGLFTICNGIVQYHLGGTRDADLRLSPTCLIFDAVRAWACEQGARVFHLGGGVGSSRDSLFSFKAGFSNRRHRFSTWRWIVDDSAYQALCEQRAARNGAAASEDFFPRYRAPVAASEHRSAVSASSAETTHPSAIR